MHLGKPFEWYWVTCVLALVVTPTAIFLRTRLYESTRQLSSLYAQEKFLRREVGALRALYEKEKVLRFLHHPEPRFRRCVAN